MKTIKTYDQFVNESKQESVDLKSIFDSLEKGKTYTVEYADLSMSKTTKTKKVTLKTIRDVNKGKVTKATFTFDDNPKGAKFYMYKRSSGKVGAAVSDSPVKVTMFE